MVSLCMIVKNEATNLGHCLMSVKSVVDEIIAVDTGSSDDTKDIAGSFGAKIFDFAWTNNFSDARNFSLSKATGKWILILDADEVISSSDHDLLKQSVMRADRENIAYNLITRNYVADPNTVGWVQNDGSYITEEAGTGWVRGDKVRLFRNDTRIRFEYPMHERVEPSLSRHGIEIRHSDITVHHYGFLSKENFVSKSERYYALLKEHHHEDQEFNSNFLYHLACEAMQLGKFEDALEFLEKLKRADPGFPKIFYYMANVYFNLGWYEDALRFSKRALQIEPDSKDTVVLYSQGEICAGDLTLAVRSLEGLSSKEPSYPLALLPLAIAYFCSGIKDKGIECINKLKTMNFGCAYYFSEFAKMLIASGRINYAILLLEASIESNNINNETAFLLQECYLKQNINIRQ